MNASAFFLRSRTDRTLTGYLASVFLPIATIIVTACSSESVEPAIGFPTLEEACPMPMQCFTIAPCEGTTVTVKGFAQYVNTYHPGVSGPNVQLKMFLFAAPEHPSSFMEVYADNPNTADAIFKQIWDAANGKSEFSGPLTVTGTVRGVDIPTDDRCTRDVNIHITSPEQIAFE